MRDMMTDKNIYPLIPDRLYTIRMYDIENEDSTDYVDTKVRGSYLIHLWMQDEMEKDYPKEEWAQPLSFKSIKDKLDQIHGNGIK
jgi:hypothetical protein